MAYVYHRGKDESRQFLCYNDTDVRRVRFEDIKGFPKLMFYVKAVSEQVVIDMREEKASEGSVDEK